MGVPKLCVPEGVLCQIRDLQDKNNNPGNKRDKLRKKYTKIVLLRFYPFYTINDLIEDKYHWILFVRELSSHKKI